MKTSILTSLILIGLSSEILSTEKTDQMSLQTISTTPKNDRRGGDGGGYSERYGNTIYFYFNTENHFGDEVSFELELNLPYDYDYMQTRFTQLNHSHGRYSENVKKDPFKFMVEDVAAKIKWQAEINDISPAALALAFSQSIPYQANMGSYQRHPSEVLLDRSGDCSDTSVLLAALLYAMNIGAVFLEYPDHLAVAVWCSTEQSGIYFYKDGRRYYLCETTSTQKIGQCSGEYCNEQALVIDLY